MAVINNSRIKFIRFKFIIIFLCISLLLSSVLECIKFVELGFSLYSSCIFFGFFLIICGVLLFITHCSKSLNIRNKGLLAIFALLLIYTITNFFFSVTKIKQVNNSKDAFSNFIRVIDNGEYEKINENFTTSLYGDNAECLTLSSSLLNEVVDKKNSYLNMLYPKEYNDDGSDYRRVQSVYNAKSNLNELFKNHSTLFNGIKNTIEKTNLSENYKDLFLKKLDTSIKEAESKLNEEYESEKNRNEWNYNSRNNSLY